MSQSSPHEYQVVARRYRPQKLGELVGQDPVATALKRALETGRVAHAYLFTGARGVGKTSTARILAKSLNCVNGVGPTPCGACENCIAIAAGEDVDVLEIDGASNRGIDEVRAIRDNVKFHPRRGRYKIYIIDEVHMLTVQAFNALLKTLEEPPPHVKFIFATTEVQKLPVTILSRCQRFDFASIGPAKIVARLREVVAQEGRTADDAALQVLARRAGGSMRDAQSLLEQLLAGAPDQLTLEQTHALLGTAPDERITHLAAAVFNSDVPGVLALLGAACDDGLQLGELVDQLIGYWRDLMILVAAGPDAAEVQATGPQLTALRKQAKTFTLDTVLAGLDILTTTRMRLRGTNHGRVLVEMGLIRLARLENLLSIAQLAQLLHNPNVANADRALPTAKTATGAPPPALPPSGTAAVDAKKKLVDTAAISPAPTTTGELSAQSLPSVWAEILVQVGPMFASNLQKAGLPAISGPKALVLAFPGGYTQEYEYCSNPQRIQRVEQALTKTLGRPCSLRIERQHAPTPASGPANGSAAPPAPRSAARSRQTEVLREPLLQRLQEVLGAALVKAEEGFGAVTHAKKPAPRDESAHGSAEE
jgi:DNA polymerase-3 subunit gamma/tau